MRRIRPQLRRVLLAGAATTALLAGFAVPASAEIVMLTDGSWLKVAEHRLVGESKVRLELRDGGALVIPLGRVERILDDEVVPRVAAAVPAVPAPLALGFDPAAPALTVPFADLIAEAGRRHDLDARLIAAVVRAESAFRADAVSHKGARGLMQLMPATARRFGVGAHEAFVPARNIEAGSRYLRWLLDRFDGELDLALAGYNAGEGTVDRYRGVPPYRETRQYIARVRGFLGLGGEATPARVASLAAR